jgi:hypothetical protein
LAEDVEAARDERRGKLGYVEPRAAQSFLTIARKPLGKALGAEPRDPITRAYFRELERKATETLSSNRALSRPFALPGATANTDCPSPVSTTGDELATPAGPSPAFTDAMGMLKEQQCERFNERMEELAYLANVLAAGAKIGNQRLRPSEAAEAAIATVALGAELEALSRRPRKPEGAYRATARELLEVLSAYGADLLFRKASSRLSARGRTISSTGFIIARDEIASVIERLSAKRTASREDSTRKKPTGRNRGN